MGKGKHYEQIRDWEKSKIIDKNLKSEEIGND